MNKKISCGVRNNLLEYSNKNPFQRCRIARSVWCPSSLQVLVPDADSYAGLVAND